MSNVRWYVKVFLCVVAAYNGSYTVTFKMFVWILYLKDLYDSPVWNAIVALDKNDCVHAQAHSTGTVLLLASQNSYESHRKCLD